MRFGRESIVCRHRRRQQQPTEVREPTVPSFLQYKRHKTSSSRTDLLRQGNCSASLDWMCKRVKQDCPLEFCRVGFRRLYRCIGFSQLLRLCISTSRRRILYDVGYMVSIRCDVVFEVVFDFENQRQVTATSTDVPLIHRLTSSRGFKDFSASGMT